jgi:dipeptidase D
MSQDHPKTQAILDIFEKLSAVPRKSKHEEKIREWLLGWAKENSLAAKSDAAGNVLIEVPGSAGYESSPTVVIQGHMDMVCEKTPDSKHDFSKDPIEFVFDGDWLKANKTTLGADNGIAIAFALILATDKETPHPPLELLFTVDEETGLTGANKLEPGFIKGKTLLNIDSEDEGVFTIGCAGGINSQVSLNLKRESTSGSDAFLLKVGGLKGGHSGVDVAKQRANAIRLLARCLDHLSCNTSLQIADIKGGSAHNAIPRDAEASVALGDTNKAQELLKSYVADLKAEYEKNEPELTITLEKSSESIREVLTTDSQKRATALILALPNGVAEMSTGIEGLVETSNNMATVEIEGETLKILSSQRSSVVSRLGEVTRRIETITELAGGVATTNDGYPPWEANWNSALMEKCKAVYQRRFGKEPVIEVIHAGLECGIIGDKNPGMDMISFGPTIENPHSPDERVRVSDIGKIWDFIADLMEELK